MNPYEEFAKFAGGIGIVAGIVLLFVNPMWGVILLLVVGIVGAGNMRRARERRHREMLEATRRSESSD